jgi:hypothetical protein
VENSLVGVKTLIDVGKIVRIIDYLNENNKIFKLMVILLCYRNEEIS